MRRGSRVAKGDILAVLQDNAAATAAIREAEEQIQVAESSLAQVKAFPTPGAITAQDAALARQDAVLQNAECTRIAGKSCYLRVRWALLPICRLNRRPSRRAQEGLRREKALLAGLTEVRSADAGSRFEETGAGDGYKKPGSRRSGTDQVRGPEGRYRAGGICSPR